MRTLIALCLSISLPSPAVAVAQDVRFTPDQLRQDLAAIESVVRDSHPDPGHSVDGGALTRSMDALKERLTGALDRDQAWREFATLNPILADGHLFVGFPDWRADSEAHRKQAAVLFPFEVHVTENGEVFVETQLGGSDTPFAGARLETINAVSARIVAAELLARAHGDTPAFRAELVSRRWWFYYWKVYGSSPVFDLVLTQERSTTVRLPGSRATPTLLADEAAFERQFSLELLPCHGALLAVRSFSWPDREQFFEFTRYAFAKIRETGVQTLLIDVRDNGGGDDDMWIRGILPYVATKPYRWASSYRKRIVEAHRDEGEKTGEIVSGQIDRWIQPEPGDAWRFSGDLYVLIGRSTYSSAILFSNVIQDFGFGTIAGTGGSARVNQSGGVQKVVLPNTGLVVWWPRFILTRPSGATHPALVQPDIAVNENPLLPGDAVGELLRRGPQHCEKSSAAL
jgi:hypothetical protein